MIISPPPLLSFSISLTFHRLSHSLDSSTSTQFSLHDKSEREAVEYSCLFTTLHDQNSLPSITFAITCPLTSFSLKINTPITPFHSPTIIVASLQFSSLLWHTSRSESTVIACNQSISIRPGTKISSECL